MTQTLKNTNKQEANMTDKTIRIGNSDLSEDAEAIQDLLKLPKTAGIMMSVPRTNKTDMYIYRPTTAITTDKDMVKTVRKFLFLISILQSQTTLTAVRDEKRIPATAHDFDQIYRALQGKFGREKD